MIFQCFVEPEQKDQCQQKGPYVAWPLVSWLNARLEGTILADPVVQKQLNEYGAMWYIWTHPEMNPDAYIGFTSWRQKEKSPFFFEDDTLIHKVLATHDILTWGWHDFAFNVHHISQMTAGELCHPGITSVLMELLFRYGEVLPAEYTHGSTGVYCSYWVMSWKNFDAWMQWSLPLVEYLLKCLENRYPLHLVKFLESSGSLNDGRAIGYIAERLFNVWIATRGKSVAMVGNKIPVEIYNRHFVGAMT